MDFVYCFLDFSVVNTVQQVETGTGIQSAFLQVQTQHKIVTGIILGLWTRVTFGMLFISTLFSCSYILVYINSLLQIYIKICRETFFTNLKKLVGTLQSQHLLTTLLCPKPVSFPSHSQFSPMANQVFHDLALLSTLNHFLWFHPLHSPMFTLLQPHWPCLLNKSGIAPTSSSSHLLFPCLEYLSSRV